MTVDKNITVDLARIQPHRVVKIHEGDVNSVFIVLTVTNLGASVSLTGLTIKYDAVINDYLAEQDASGTVDTTNNTIRIPVTSNMTAMSGTLRVDVRMINNTEVLYTQTINMLVERSVVEGSTVIDFSGITIVQQLNNKVDKTRTIADIDLQDDITATELQTALGISGKVGFKSISSDELDTATDHDVIYLVNDSATGYNDGHLVFHGEKKYSGEGTLIVSQTHFRADGSVRYRQGTSTDAGSGANWTGSEWKPLVDAYSKTYIDENYRKTVYHSHLRPPCIIQSENAFQIGDVWITHDSARKYDDHTDPRTTSGRYRVYKLLEINESSAVTGDYIYIWGEITSSSFQLNDTSINTAIAISNVDYDSSIGICGEDNYLSIGNIVWVTDISENITNCFLVTNTSITYNRQYNTYVKNIESIELSIPENTYTKTEVDSLISAISTLSFEVAQTKPTTNIKTNVIYLIPNGDSGTDNIYDEWIYVNNAWELIGSTAIDISGKEDTSNKTNAITDDNKTSTSAYTSVKAVVDYVNSIAGDIGTALDTLNDNLSEV